MDFRSFFIEFTTPFLRFQSGYLTRFPLSLPSREVGRVQSFSSEQHTNLDLAAGGTYRLRVSHSILTQRVLIFLSERPEVSWLNCNRLFALIATYDTFVKQPPYLGKIRPQSY